MKLAFYLVVTLIVTLILYVGVLPAMISAKDTMSVLGGIVITIFYPVCLYRIFKPLIRKYLS